MKCLTREQIIAAHAELITEFGGIIGVRDEMLLDSALSAPFQTWDGAQMFPTVHQKAARLAFGLITNHPFIDGNKRVGAHVMIVTLALNGIDLDYTQDELYDIILRVAASDAAFDELLRWVLSHTP
ncbi:MAG: type II toxin-antitoxin system death-on-curing family toxin [Oscillospiraceae bacterium]|nr:type II toxin-antitoxin system death-on-curing family toxin [Oscillospiraceae bacterium]